jgi:hypothetical protein
MVLTFMLIGIAVLAASIWARRKNKKVIVSDIGIALGIGRYFLRYPLDGTADRYTIHGVPFMSYAFDQRGHDYVGPLMLPALVLNFVTCCRSSFCGRLRCANQSERFE